MDRKKNLKYRKNFGVSNVFHISKMIFWQNFVKTKFCHNILPPVKDDFLAETSSKSNLSPTDSFLTRFINELY